jgi:glycosyltransferase involved in cell wall biosynthesis
VIVATVFDLYLPDTMNWAQKIIDAMPEVQTWICAPVFLTPHPEQPLVPPYQRWLRWYPRSETAATQITRLEARIPLYRNWLSRQFEKQKPDLLHVHFGPVACRYMHLAKDLDIPLIVTFHGYDYLKAPRRNPSLAAHYRKLFEIASVVACGGEKNAAILMEAGCPVEKTTVIPIGAHTGEFQFIPRTKTPGRLHLVQVGTITAKKGYMDSLAAVLLAKENCPGLELTISGEPYEKALVLKMRQFIADNRMEPWVHWLPPVSPRDMPAFLSRGFDVFIQPCCTAPDGDLEGGPITVMEAQSTGMPVISTTHMNIPTEVLHGHTGLLAPENRPDQLAAYIEYFYRMDNVEYQTFSVTAREHMIRHFDIRDTAKRYAALYQNLMS